MQLMFKVLVGLQSDLRTFINLTHCGRCVNSADFCFQRQGAQARLKHETKYSVLFNCVFTGRLEINQDKFKRGILTLTTANSYLPTYFRQDLVSENWQKKRHTKIESVPR